MSNTSQKPPVSRHLSFNEHGATRKDCLELGLCITQTPNWCSSALQRQTASAGALRNWHFDDTVLPRRVLTTSYRFGSSPTVPKISSPFAKIWQDVVESYSGKDLTYHTDKLPALAGLAKNFQCFGIQSYYTRLFAAGSSDHIITFCCAQQTGVHEIDCGSTACC